MATAITVVATMLVGALPFVGAEQQYCGVDYPEWGMSRVVDKYCASKECKDTPNCTIGCIGDDIPSGCSWCVWDMDKCQKSYEPNKTYSMCAEFAKYGLERSKNPDGPKCKGVAPYFELIPGYCFKEKNPVPNLKDGYMTVEAAQFACFYSFDGRSNNCKGFFYYNNSGEQSSLLQVGEPNLTCGVDMPWYGEKLITDPKCTDPTCTHDCQIGCIGADNPTCARCIYNYRSCISTFERPQDCDELVRGQELRGNPDCSPPIHHGVYVEFSTKWDLIHEGTGACRAGQLGASLRDSPGEPIVAWNPASALKDSTFDGKVERIDIKGKEGNPYSSATAALNDCHRDFLNPANKDAPCQGFYYNYQSNVIQLLHTPANITFATGVLTPINKEGQATYVATWKPPLPKPAPAPAPPSKEELMV